MNKFEVGDLIEVKRSMSSMAAKKGARAYVTRAVGVNSYFMQIAWVRDTFDCGQRDGGYNESEFKLVNRRDNMAKKIEIVITGGKEDKRTALVSLLKERLKDCSYYTLNDIINQLDTAELTTLAKSVHGRIYERLGQL